jgi:transposase
MHDTGGRVNEEQDVTVGVDTHKDVHVAAVLDQAGRVIATRSFPTTMRGYAQLATWAESFGTVVTVGMEGTGSHGAGLLRFLTEYGLAVVEVDRPDRATRRRIGKTDTIDAESAARAVLSGRACGTPKTRDAQVEMIRALRVARRGAMKAASKPEERVGPARSAPPGRRLSGWRQPSRSARAPRRRQRLCLP